MIVKFQSALLAQCKETLGAAKLRERQKLDLNMMRWMMSNEENNTTIFRIY